MFDKIAGRRFWARGEAERSQAQRETENSPKAVFRNPTLSANEKGPLWGLFRLGGAELFVRAQGAARQKICCI
jgi:hypothetical protein